MKKISILLGALGFLLYRPHAMQHSGMLYPGDDQNYLAHATSLVYGTFPDYSLEANADFPPFHPFGPALLAAPFVFGGSVIDRILSSPLTNRRQFPDLFSSWTLFGFVFATLFYFHLGIVLVFATLKSTIGKEAATWATVLSVVSSGLMLYAYRRPVFSHVYEFCAVAGILYGLSTLDRSESFNNRRIWFGWTLIWAIALCTIRYNDLFLSAASVATGGWLLRKHVTLRKSMIITLTSFALLLASVGGCLYVANDRLRDIKFTSSHRTEQSFSYIGNLPEVIKPKPASFYAINLRRVFFGIDWGIAFTSPLLLLSLLGVSITKGKAKWLLLPFVALSVNLTTCVMWGGQGSWYGYRYLVYAWLPISTFMLGLWMNATRPVFLNRIRWMMLMSIWPVLSMLMFEGNSTTLTVSLDQSPAILGWINPLYQVEVLHTLLNPRELFYVLRQGGPSYVVYLFNLARNGGASPIDWGLFIKTMIIWSFPIWMFGGARWAAKRFGEH